MNQLSRRSLVLLAMPVLAGCAIVREASEVTRPAVEGEWTVADGSEPRAFRPIACSSGEAQSFLGFDVAAEDGVLRAVVDPLDGPALRWSARSEAGPVSSLIWRRADCETLEIGIQPSGWRINDWLDFNGEIAARCRDAEGRSLEARLSIRHCH